MFTLDISMYLRRPPPWLSIDITLLSWLPTSPAWTSSIGHRFERTCAKASLSIVEQRFNSGALDVHFNTEWHGGIFKGVNGRGIILATSSLTKKHLQMIENQFWQLFENNTWDVFKKNLRCTHESK